jgi:hypothetical protein
VIAGLEAWLRSIEPAGAPELEATLEQLFGAAGARMSFEGGQTLRPAQVHRLRFRAEACAGRAGSLHSLVVKRLSLDRSNREQRAVRLWLPRVGLGAHAAPLLEVAAARRADCVWHVYEDLGDATLARVASEPGPLREKMIRAALELVAALHLRFVAQPLLAECRLAGLDLGAGFFAASTGDAARSLAALLRLGELPPERQPLIERLLERLTALAAEGDARARAFAELGWPETLLHGDLWLTNVMLGSDTARPQARLIDWERAGVGAPLYDLSSFLRQLPALDRAWILDAYRECVQPAGWRWPEPALLERVAESCELGRFASCLLWRTLYALELQRGGDSLPEWLFDDLVEMERWFAERAPLLPEGREASAA